MGDLFSNTGKFLQGSKILTANVTPTRYFKLIGVVDVILIVWRFIIKHELQTNQHL